MNWTRYSGRIILAVGVVAIASWATHEKLLDVPADQFWVVILSYLVGAEIIWTLVDLMPTQPDRKLAQQGLRRLKRREQQKPVPALWLYDGGRVRLADALVDNDIPRDAHQTLLATVLTREVAARLHVISGAPGSGRSTMLLRLGRALAEQGQTVFMGLPGPDITGLSQVVEAAKKEQVYLLLDDLDLRPQAEEWLYDIFRAGLPVVVIATACHAQEPHQDLDDLEALQPAGFLAQATIHTTSITPNDLPALAQKLKDLGRQQKAGIPAEAAGDMVRAMRHVQGRAPAEGLWQELDRGKNLPLPHELMLALCGLAEVALPEALAASALGEKTLPRWQRAGLVAVEEGLILPAHRSVCLDLIEKAADGGAVAAALDQLLTATAEPCPMLAPRLLFGLYQLPETAALVVEYIERAQPVAPEVMSSDPVHRAWGRVWDALGLQVAGAEDTVEHPPQLSPLIESAMTRGDYARALQLGRKLARSPIYAAAAQFNLALALSHLGRFTEADEELESLKPGPPGTSYLRAVLAEKRGEYLAALDGYENSRRLGELQLPATRRLAFCYIRTGAPKAAIPLFEAVLSYTPLRADLYGGLAVAHLHAGMGQRAAAQSARAIQAGVEPVLARKAVAKACAEAHAYDRAATELEACVLYDAGDLDAWADLATACRWIGRFAREEECLRRVQAADPDDPELRLRTARCQRDQGRAQETLELLKPLLHAVAQSEPAEATRRALLLAAETAGTNGDLQSQRQWARQAIEHGDDTGWGQFWLASSYADVAPEAEGAYRLAVRDFRAQLTEGVPPRKAATLWQALYLAALAQGDETLKAQAERKARQEVSVCQALGTEVESVLHRRSVPSDVFLETFGDSSIRDVDQATPGARVEAPVLRARANQRTQRGQ